MRKRFADHPRTTWCIVVAVFIATVLLSAWFGTNEPNEQPSYASPSPDATSSHKPIEHSPMESEEDITYVSEEIVEDVFRQLRPSQLLVFTSDSVRLRGTLHVTANNVTIRGALHGTAIECPRDDAALWISGHGVVIEGLRFENCVLGTPVVQIDSGYNPALSQSNGVSSGEESTSRLPMLMYDVSLRKCQFLGSGSEVRRWSFELLRVRRTSVRIEGCEFKRNSVRAIFASDGSELDVEDTFIAGNSVDVGELVYAKDSRVRIHSSIIDDNSALWDGTSLCSFRDSNVSITDTIFRNNWSIQESGVIKAHKSQLLIHTCSFVGNHARHTGAIAAFNSTVAISNSTFLETSVEVNIGVMYGENTTLVITNSSFAGNRAGEYDGVMLTKKSIVEISNSTFFNNSAKLNIGVIRNEETKLAITNSSFVGNRAGEYVGVMLTDKSTVEISNSTFFNNSAELDIGVMYGEETKLVITDSSFVGNRAEKYTGVTFTKKSTVAISNSTFLDNSVEANIGVMYTENTTLVITNSSFAGNRAGEYNGVMLTKKSIVEISNSTFFNNSAKLSIGVVRNDKTKLVITNSSFVGNQAGEYNGVMLTKKSIVEISNSTFFNNSAKLNVGVIRNDETKLAITNSPFVGNQAGKHVGVMLTVKSIVEISNSTFFNNSAKLSEGVMFGETTKMVISNSSFVGNRAGRHGGVIHIRTSNLLTGWSSFKHSATTVTPSSASWARKSSLHIMDCKFSKNHARKRGGVIMASDTNASISNSLFTRNKAGKDGGALWLNQTRLEIVSSVFKKNSARVNGGAIYLKLVKDQNQSKVSIILNKVTAIRNRASVGGGLYMETIPDTWASIESNANSTELSPTTSCLHFNFTTVIVTHNVAYTAGGGVFLHSFRDFLPVCSSEPIGLRRPATQNCISVRNNNLSGDHGYGPNVATNASSLSLTNLDDILVFTPQRPMQIRCNRSSIDCPESGTEGIKIEVVDCLNQRIVGRIDGSDLQVEVSATRYPEFLNGQAQYTAQDGLIVIDNTTIIRPNIDDQIFVRVAGERNDLTTTFSVRTSLCFETDLFDENNTHCFRCLGSDQYTFKPTERCLECEPEAICTGTTVLVPRAGFWHSTPYSPEFRRCLVKEACTWEGREQSLMLYYYNYSHIRDEIEHLESLDRDEFEKWKPRNYNQCAEGYQDLLCGACSEGHGRSAEGTCIPCNNGGVQTFIQMGLMGMLLAVTLGTKLIFTVVASRTEILAEVANKTDILRRAEVTQSDTDERIDEKLPAAQRASTSAASGPLVDNMSTPRIDEGSSKFNASPPRQGRPDELCRSWLITADDNIDGSNTTLPTPASIESSAILADTFNLLYNYVQLNSVALSMDINWHLGLNTILQIQSSFARIRNTVHIAPYGCVSSNGRKQKLSSSMQAWLYRLLIPVSAFSIFLIAVPIWNAFVSKRQATESDNNRAAEPQNVQSNESDVENQQSQAAAAAAANDKNISDSKRYKTIPWQLVFLLMFSSTCIDIVAELLRVINCAHIPATNSKHRYANFNNVRSILVWAEDTTIECFVGQHLVATIFASCGLALCLLVLILMAYIFYYRHKHAHEITKEFEFKYGFLYASYRKKGLSFYWEAVLMVRRILLAVFSVYTLYSSKSNAQIGVLVTIVFGALAVQSLVQPFADTSAKNTFPSYAGSVLRFFFRDRITRKWVAFHQDLSLNGLENCSLFMSLSIFVTVVIVHGEESTNLAYLLTLTCVVANSIFALFIVYRIWFFLHNYLDVLIYDSEGGTSSEELGLSTAFLIKKLIWVFTSRRFADNMFNKLHDLLRVFTTPFVRIGNQIFKFLPTRGRNEGSNVTAAASEEVEGTARLLSGN